MFKSFPNFRQRYLKECGPACLKIITKYYGKNISLEKIVKLSQTTRVGTKLSNLSKASEGLGFKSITIQVDLDTLSKAPLPCILFWDEKHYIVLYKIKRDKFYISDPEKGNVTYTKKEFSDNWLHASDSKNDLTKGIALLLEPTENFFLLENEKYEAKINFKFLNYYFRRYKKYFFQILIGLIVSSIIQFLIPFLTQSIVDNGIKNNDFIFIEIVFIALVSLILGDFFIRIIRGWILLHISSRIKLSIISDFIIRLMDLPISFFESKLTGDILLRTGDVERVKIFITTSSLNFIFSAFNVIIFGLILLTYNFKIFLVFIVMTLFYFIWFSVFLKKRGLLDTLYFKVFSKDRSKIIELVDGMEEIKLNNAERKKRWSWEKIQIDLYDIEKKKLKLIQLQSDGADLLNELKNIFLIILSSYLVIQNQITLGMLIAVMFIIGQLNSPLRQFLTFLLQIQDASFSLSRLADFKNQESEDNLDVENQTQINEIEDINFLNISFKYPGSDKNVLKNLNFSIPKNKVTALVGKSGSGKTTILKLLLKFHKPEGDIKIGKTSLTNITHYNWRELTGAVLQEGKIFNASVEENISISDEVINNQKVDYAIKIANLDDFISNLHLGKKTLIGKEGVGISGGEKQRILIARAIYKDPEILLFDEATSSLDTQNERIIVNNIEEYLKNKTSLIIAHRLSTVKNADNIIVIDKGEIIEQGNHLQLTEKKGFYFNLIKNQLELGN